ncbi:uncharacterized protein L3040_001033 [Drepanopeziza brunnea f. sp. 'multigermtubi']|uniref:uncharacterized protein n=1 Tax=Drepanopeziza brunnea f. sp. 'multigermtubi' TaxID=698441 RepID=UPI0023A163E9|nr:hypothetical protein L3040_001033 [Drepanopeziza brunnea f. sp. 'multigermtubi']
MQLRHIEAQHPQFINFSFPRKEESLKLEMAAVTVPPATLTTTATESSPSDVAPRPLHLDTEGKWVSPVPAASTGPTEPTEPPKVVTPAAAPAVPPPVLTVPKPAEVSPGYEASTSSTSSSPSSNPGHSIKSTRYEDLKSLKSPDEDKKRGKGKKVKEVAFFAFVLLPLSCWYTRGGKRLGPVAKPGRRVADDEETRAIKALPELRRPATGRPGTGTGRPATGVRTGFGPVPNGHIHPARRDSFAAAQDRSNSFSHFSQSRARSRSFTQGHGRDESFGQMSSASAYARSNSFTQRGGVGGRNDVFGRAPGKGGNSLRRDSWSGPAGIERREVLDYGVDRGADLDALGLGSRSRSGEPVPLRKRKMDGLA